MSRITKRKKADHPDRKLFWENKVVLSTEKSGSEACFVQAAPEVIRWVTKVVPYLSGRLTWAENDHKRVLERGCQFGKLK